MPVLGKAIPGALGRFEGEPIVMEQPGATEYIADLASFLLFCQEKGGYWLPLPGDPARREFDNYDRIYYTFHAVSALLDTGFPVSALPIKKAFDYLDSFPGVSINYRPFYYLYLPLGRMTEPQLVEFLVLLRKYQIRAEDYGGRFVGSFLFAQGWTDESAPVKPHWQGPLHLGGVYFHACHLGYLLAQVSKELYPKAYGIARNLLTGIVGFLAKTLSETGRIPYADGSDSPDLTLWAYSLSDHLEIVLPENYIENIGWAIQTPTKGFLAKCFVTTNSVQLSSKLQLPPDLIRRIEDNILDTHDYLITHHAEIKRSPRDAAIAMRTYLRIGAYLDKDFRYVLMSHLIRYFSEC